MDDPDPMSLERARALLADIAAQEDATVVAAAKRVLADSTDPQERREAAFALDVAEGRI